MKLLVVAICALLAISAHAEDDWVEIDWSSVIPIQESPGFWDGRDVKPVFNPKDPKRSGRVADGLIVVPHSHPHQAGLLVRVSAFNTLNTCAGSLITERAILTAAQCLIEATSAQVILGAHRMTVVEPSQQRQTVQPAGYRIHPRYSRETFQNDIAVMILNHVVTLNSFVSVVALPPFGETNQFNQQQGIIAGWGRISEWHMSMSDYLRYIQNPIMSNEVCSRDRIGHRVAPNIICLSGEGGRAACGGDAGAPLTVMSGNTHLQVGITTFSAGCGRGDATFCARITSFRQWIDNML